MRHIASILLLTAAVAANAASLPLQIDSLVNARYIDADAPGAAIIIARGDSILYERYIGLADIPAATPIGPDTRFCIASVSKQFTVMALLQCDSLYNGNIALLDSPVSRWFDYTQPFWQDITLRSLASHTSGVPDTRPRTNRDWCVHADDSRSIEYFPSVDSLTFGPGEYYDYLNPSFILLARVVENISGMPFTQYVDSNIFVPAGMSDTYYFDASAPSQPGRSHAYIPGPDGKWMEYDYGEETFFATLPDGGIYSTARDLLAWENALRDGIIVDRDHLALAYRPAVSVSDSPFCDYQRRPHTWYGLGFFIDHPAGRQRKVYHTGDNGGYQAYLAKYPDDDVKIIILENRNDLDRWDFATELEILLGLR